MADTVNIELIDNVELKASYPYWNIFPLIEQAYTRGKTPQLYHVMLEIDTSTVTTATESTDPTNIVFNYAAPEQVYLRSDAAGDVSKKIDVIGEKSDGSFGQFTLTSDASDGTTAVDVGLWNFISFVIKNDDWAGNVIIDDDGASTTVYWTAPLGATATTGIVVIPTGFRASIAQGLAVLRAVPAAQPNAMVINFGHNWNAILTDQYHKDIHDRAGFVAVPEMRVEMKHFYLGAATVTTIHMVICLWEV